MTKGCPICKAVDPNHYLKCTHPLCHDGRAGVEHFAKVVEDTNSAEDNIFVEHFFEMLRIGIPTIYTIGEEDVDRMEAIVAKLKRKALTCP